MCTEAKNRFLLKPHTFMRSNIVMVIASEGAMGGERTFYFKKAAIFGYNMLDGGQMMNVYSLSENNVSGDAEPVRLWWCPYQQNQAHGVTLPGAGGPNIMFTYAMNGCTLAAGSRTADKAVRVHHINQANAIANMANATPQQRAQRQYRVQRRLARNLVQNPSLVDPEDYYDPTKAIVAIPAGARISTVTFGRRSSHSGWEFYTHQWYTVEGSRRSPRFIGTKHVI